VQREGVQGYYIYAFAVCTFTQEAILLITELDFSLDVVFNQL
jgi:hypothetical protein